VFSALLLPFSTHTHENIHQYACVECKAQDSNEIHTSLEKCGNKDKAFPLQARTGP
jgi:hypothetical protein